GKRLQTLFTLSEKGYYEIYLTKICYNEIISQYKKRCKKALEHHNNLINDKDNVLKVLKNNSQSKNILKKFPSYNNMVDEFSKKLDSTFQIYNVNIISYPNLDTSIIFDDYFLN